MPSYDFTQDLSHLDFEILSKDLLEADLKVKFENFRDGRDGGIDLRHARQGGNCDTIIVQCKRFAAGDYSGLKSHLRLKELGKVKALNPDRYILVTSVSLSPQQSDELASILSPYVKSTSDIYGRERLNSLLAKYSDIERRHVKLWIGGAGVLNSFLNTKTHIISREEVEKSIKTASLYVKNESLNRAIEILERDRVCIVSGNPGIGKTTLARILMLLYHEKNFDIVKIDGDISEARAVGFHEKHRFYFYDDFLGQTSLSQKFGKNEDQRILEFMESVRSSSGSVFVLTTREYILNQARMTYERINRQDFSPYACVLNLKDYTRRNRAEILYNHLYFSKVPSTYIKSIVSNKNYIKIFDHENFSPRIVEYITKKSTYVGISPDKYAKFALSCLDNPVEIWNHAFDNQIGLHCQVFLYCLYTFEKPAFIDDLEIYLKEVYSVMCRDLNRGMGPADLNLAIKELLGNFITTEGKPPNVTVEFHNPSIRDYMKRKVKEAGVVEFLYNKSLHFEQAKWLYKQHAGEVPTLNESRLMDLFGSPSCQLIYLVNFDSTKSFSRFQNAEVGRFLEIIDLVSLEKPFIGKALGIISDKIRSGAITPSMYMPLVKSLMANSLFNNGIRKEIVADFSRYHSDLDDIDAISEMVTLTKDVISESEYNSAESAIDEMICTYVGDYESYNIDNPETIRQDAERIEAIGLRVGLNVESQIGHLNTIASRIDDAVGGEEDDQGSGYYSTVEDRYDDSEADSMFRTLDE